MMIKDDDDEQEHPAKMCPGCPDDDDDADADDG